MSIDTISDLPPRVQYIAAAAQTVFDYPFPIFADADLVVDVDGATQALATDYTVAGEGEDAGGTVTFLSALAGDEIVTIYRDMAIERTTDFSQNGEFSSATFNDELDRITLVLQDLRAQVQRSLRLPMTAEVADTETEFTPVSSWANKFVYLGTNGVPEPATAVTGSALSASTVGAVLYPRSAEEVTLAVVPTAYNYPVGNILRYGGDPTGVAMSDAAINNAIAVVFAQTYGGTVFFPAGQYRINAEIVLPKSYTKAIRLVGEGPRTSQIYSVSNIAAGSPLMRWDTATANSVQLFSIEGLGLVRLNGGPLLQFRQSAGATGAAGDRIAVRIIDVLLRQSTSAGQNANLDFQYSLKSYVERLWLEGGNPSGIGISWATCSQDYFCEIYNNGKTSVGDFFLIDGGGDHTLVATRGEGCAGNYFYKLLDCDHVTLVSPWSESDVASDVILFDGARYCTVLNASIGNQTGATNPNGIRFASTTRGAVGNFVTGGKSASFDTLGTGAAVVFNADASSNVVQNLVIEGVASVTGEATNAGTDNFCTLIAGGGTPPTVQTIVSAPIMAGGVRSRGHAPTFGSTDNYSVNFVQNNATAATLNATNLNLASGITLHANGTQVIGTRVTGWTAASGTATRTTFATTTVTTELLAQRVKALIDDLIAHGVIGT